MKILKVDATNWRTMLDYCDAIRDCLGSPAEHGTSVDAFLDSMIWHDDLNEVPPPFEIRVSNALGLPKAILDEVELLRDSLLLARRDFFLEEGYDREVSLIIVS